MLVVVAFAGASCTTSPGALVPAATSDSHGASPTGNADSPAVDAVTPLVVSTISPDPQPFRGSDGQFHIAYELSVLNFSPAPAVITGVDSIGPSGEVLASLTQSEAADRTMVVADYSGQPAKGTIPPGRSALLVLENVFPTRDDVPESITNRISTTLGTPETGGGAIAVLWPESATQFGPTITIGAGDPVQLGAPLSGEGWWIGSGCCTLNAHRNVILPVDGRMNGGERYALDIVRVDPDGLVPGGAISEFEYSGDPKRNDSYHAYQAPVLAVADATVVDVIDSVADTPAGSLPLGPGFTLANLGGNAVVLELGPELFAVYYHLRPDSITVAVGDHVTKGQQIAELGNSGNTSAPHLHFQVSRTPLIFSSDSVPFVFDEITVDASIDRATGQVSTADPYSLDDAAPLDMSVITFP